MPPDPTSRARTGASEPLWLGAAARSLPADERRLLDELDLAGRVVRRASAAAALAAAASFAAAASLARAAARARAAASCSASRAAIAACSRAILIDSARS